MQRGAAFWAYGNTPLRTPADQSVLVGVGFETRLYRGAAEQRPYLTGFARTLAFYPGTHL